MPPGFHRLIAAQFLSALADNALLIVTLALLIERQMAPWLAPLLKFGFTLAYVVLAPVVGELADRVSKARLMAWMNALKMAGVGLLLVGLDPLLGYAVVGLGAAAYAPAKYGLVTERVPAARLVAANGWIEVSVVGAVLLGTALGGLLVSDVWRAAGATQATAAWLGSGPLGASLLAVLAVHTLSALVNLGLPGSGARYPHVPLRPGVLAAAFWRDHLRLWRDRDGSLSLAATTLFWGVGATLQFVVLRWATERLGLSLAQAAWLQGVVALGVIAGAGAAGRWVPLHAARRMLPFGVALGLAMPLVAAVDDLALAVPLLVGVGACGGLMVVPLNALLQHRGCQLLSAGRSIAVQGFNENASVLVMLALYAALVWADVPLRLLMGGFGLSIATAVALLMVRERRLDLSRPCADADAQPAGPGRRPPAPARPEPAPAPGSR